MTESQIDLAEGELVSDFEFILPWDVIETCCSLKPQGTSCFVSLNKQAKTSNQLFVSKLEDDSIKIRIRVVNIDGEKDKDCENKNDQEGKCPTEGEYQANLSAQEVDAPVLSETADPPSEFKQQENVDMPETNAEDSTSDILNKMIMEEQDGIDKGDQSNKATFSDGLSTVIIVKKVSSLTATQTLENEDCVDNLKSDKEPQAQSKVNKENLEEISMAGKGELEAGNFTVVKPKASERVENKDETFGSGSSGGQTQVTCELCFQQYESYSHLVRHVRKQHRDCTFVRNYLEEIRPLTITPCPICKRNFTAKSSLDAHLKVSHGGQFVRIKNLPATSSKLEANSSQQHPTIEPKRRNADGSKSAAPKTQTAADLPLDASKAESESDEDSDSSAEATNGKQRVKCDVCNESFETRQQALKHQDRVHRRQVRKEASKETTSESFSCKYCDKKLKTKELLLKHCLGTHFKSNSPGKNKRPRSTSTASEDNFDISDEDLDVEGQGAKRTPAQRSRQRGRGERGNSRSVEKRRGKNRSQQAGADSLLEARNSSGFICDLCGTEFNRMTLLVTHARYCRKSAAPK